MLRGHRLVAGLLVLIVIAAACGAWLLLRDGDTESAAPSTATVARETVEETVAASGTVVAAHSATHAFAVSGTVTAVDVAVGDAVSKGDPLAEVDSAFLTATRVAARSALDAARVALAETEDGGSDDVQLAADRAAVAAAEADLAAAEQAVDDSVLRADVAGRVVDVGLQVGDSVGNGQGATSASASQGSANTDSGAITVTSSQQFRVEATVASVDVERLAVGQQAEITVNGVEDVVYGTVDEVGLVAETNSSGAAVFPVVVAVTGQRSDLFGGTSAELTVTVKRTEGVLTVASRALQSGEDGATYVEVVTDEGTTRSAVEVGTVYGQTTAVVSGLEEGDVVDLPEPERREVGDGDDTPQRGGRGGLPGGGRPAGGFPGGGGGQR